MSPAPNQPLQELPLLTIEGVEFIYNTNFAGEARPPYDKAGERYFNARIPSDEQAEIMARDGWNVKWTKPSKTATQDIIDQHVPVPYLTVAVGFKFRPPTILMIRNDRPVVISERTCGILDSTEFTKVDVTVRARWWENDSGKGYKAWLSEFYGHVQMSELGNKYAHLLDTPAPEDEQGL